MDETEIPATRTRNNATEIITSGHVWSAVWYVAWPTAINTLIQTAYVIINGAFVGRLPDATRALAAVGIGSTLLMIQFGVVMALSVGTSALVSRFLGAEQHDDADEAMRQSLILCILCGIPTGIPLILWAAPLVRLLGAAPNVVPVCADYTAVISWSTVPLFLYVVITAALRSAGDVRSVLCIGAAVLALNTVLDYVLIFGVGPFPRMGVHGAAIATCISRLAGMATSFWYLKRSVLGGSLSHFRPSGAWFKRILNIGWPAAVMNLLWSTAAAAFLKILGVLPAGEVTAAQAALAVGSRVEGIAYMFGIAYSMAATPLVGQNLGAGKPERAEHTAWVATGQAVFIMASVALVFFFAPTWLAHLFTHEKAVVPLIVSYLRINAFCEPFLALNMVLRGALQGAGETRTPAVITVLALWVVRIPLALLLAKYLGYGAPGAWAAMSVTTALCGILMAACFKWGSWRTLQV